MRNAIVLFTVTIAFCGCSKHEGGEFGLEPLARGLADAWQPVVHDMKLAIRPEVDGNHVTLRCVIRNVSASEIDVDQESLPWNNAEAFSISVWLPTAGSYNKGLSLPQPFFHVYPARTHLSPSLRVRS